ncbi:MAG: N-succinylarginine dihydrolase, partial [Symploca sp. SIO2D2]|nr:N-succinylarginine dihydrolase [Symploca sp. SIO2D2]
MYQEINFDGLIGPTHNYAGLSEGNVASLEHRNRTSRPLEAALQGLSKMKTLADLGVPQAVLPPLERPSIQWLKKFGIEASDEAATLAKALEHAPQLLAACSSASSMWTANAGTMSPSCDSEDGLMHFTPANLSSKLHRAIEAEETAAVIRRIFADDSHFVIHDPLPGGEAMRDEGAANHTRLTNSFEKPGTHLFVYGSSALRSDIIRPKHFPSRQTLEASQAIARLHKLDPRKTLFMQQSPQAIDAGVFHNDVIAVGHLNVLLYHENAFIDGRSAIDQISLQFGGEFNPIEVAELEVSLQEAVSSYLFNSQLVSLSTGGIALIAPQECSENDSVHGFLQ